MYNYLSAKWFDHQMIRSTFWERMCCRYRGPVAEVASLTLAVHLKGITLVHEGSGINPHRFLCTVVNFLCVQIWKETLYSNKAAALHDQ